MNAESDISSGAATARRVSYRVLTASRMWQSAEWIANSVNVLSDDERDGRAPLPSPRSIAWRLARGRRHADVVCTSGEVNLWYRLLCALTPWWSRPHVMGELFLPEPRPASAVWRLKRAVRRMLFRGASTFVVYSEGERRLWADYLDLPVERFQTHLFHTNVLAPHLTPPGSYGFAAGRSERDFATFMEAVRGLDYRFVVVADAASVAGLTVPDNVDMHVSIPRERYLELLEGAAFTVLPLHERQRSSGQVVLLEGYALGKPAVATRMVGTEDYLIDGETGWFCTPYDAVSMRAAITRLMALDDAARDRMARRALDLVLASHTFEKFVERQFEIIESVLPPALTASRAPGAGATGEHS